MKLSINIIVDVSETIADSIRRGNFHIDRDGNGHKLKIGSTIEVPRRKCIVSVNNITPLTHEFAGAAS